MQFWGTAIRIVDEMEALKKFSEFTYIPVSIQQGMK
jgi:hypothetical protein